MKAAIAALHLKARKDRSLDHTPTAASTALSISEVLETIFSFLSQDTLRVSTRLVCKQWFHISHRFVNHRGTWKDHYITGADNDPTAWMRDLEQYRSLLVDLQQDTWGTGPRPNLSPAEEQAIAALCQEPPKRHLHEIIVRGDRQLYILSHRPLLPYFQHVKSLHLEFIMHNPLDLAQILRCCILLEVLDLRAVCDNSGVNYRRRPKILTFNDSTSGDNAMLQGLRLCQFRAHNAQASFDTLCKLVDAAPELRVFSFHAWVPIWRWHPTRNPTPAIASQLLSNAECQLLYGHIINACPSIRQVQYSVPGRIYPIDDFRSWVSTFPRLSEWSLAATDLTLGQPNEDDGNELPMIYSSNANNSNDLSILLVPAMVRLKYLCFTVNRLTSLEIQAIYARTPTQEDLALAQALHFFLCSSPLLIHLKAPNVVFLTGYLDFKPHSSDATSEWWSSQRDIIGYWNLETEGTEQDEQPARQRCRPIWACRGLQTLHLAFQSRVFYSSPTMYQARIVFGYISLVCPQLRDLSIRHPYLHMGLEGGLCMLARLKWLERLSIQSGLPPEPKPKLKSSTELQELNMWWLKIMIARKKSWNDSRRSKKRTLRQLQDKARRELKRWRKQEKTVRSEKVGRHGLFRNLQDEAEAEATRYYDTLDSRDPDEMAIIQALTHVQGPRVLIAFTESLFLKENILARRTNVNNRTLGHSHGHQYDGSMTDDCAWPRLDSLELTFSTLKVEIAELVDELRDAMRQLRPDVRITIQGKTFVDWVLSNCKATYQTNSRHTIVHFLVVAIENEYYRCRISLEGSNYSPFAFLGKQTLYDFIGVYAHRQMTQHTQAERVAEDFIRALQPPVAETATETMDEQLLQAFRCRSTGEECKVQVQKGATPGEPFVLWSDIEDAFPDLRSIKLGEIAVNSMKDEAFKRIEPRRINYYPGALLDVVTGSDTQSASACDVIVVTKTAVEGKGLHQGNAFHNQPFTDGAIGVDEPIDNSAALVVMDMDSNNQALVKYLNGSSDGPQSTSSYPNEILQAFTTDQRIQTAGIKQLNQRFDELQFNNMVLVQTQQHLDSFDMRTWIRLGMELSDGAGPVRDIILQYGWSIVFFDGYLEDDIILTAFNKMDFGLHVNYRGLEQGLSLLGPASSASPHIPQDTVIDEQSTYSASGSARSWTPLRKVMLRGVQLQRDEWSRVIESLGVSALEHLDLNESNIVQHQFEMLVDRILDSSAPNLTFKTLEIRQTSLAKTTNSGTLDNIIARLRKKAPLVKIILGP
ncbi:MAG: hypothetical protein J3Q66DRAFT_398146 [Benniella sp.]|nr:MAG: hypothetical protein J3Q66DRAFT_398146 [Benniella sp.]